MKLTTCQHRLSFIVCLVLIAALALCTTGCNDTPHEQPDVTTTTVTTMATQNGDTATAQTTTTQPTTIPTTADGKLICGEGATVFDFTVTAADGTKTVFEIHTDKKTVGNALYSLGLIDGESGDFGLYVKTVNGQTLDYDKDGYYWAFYVDGSYAMSGVEQTDIAPNAAYEFKAEKA